MERLINDIFSNKKIVVITGAGVSVESGLRPFRGKDGWYEDKNEDGFDVRKLFTQSYVMEHPDEFYEFFSNNMMIDDKIPNIIHNVLAKLEELGLIEGIITQNFDLLHEKAGSKNVIDLHGTADKYHCVSCNTEYTADDFRNNKGKCNCGNCTGFMLPNLVFYQDPDNPDKKFDIKKYCESLKLVNSAEVLLVLGTSLSVTDIQSLLTQFTHADDPDKVLYIVNKTTTSFNSYADMYGAVYPDLREVFERLDQEIKERAPKQMVKTTSN